MNYSPKSGLFDEITVIPEILDQKIYPSLNGLRGVSILMVLIYHFFDLYHPGTLTGIYFIGPLGVDIFFVISGFLITTLCIKEKVLTGNLSLRSFYTRRALRILPVAYLYIFVVIIVNGIFKLNIGLTSFLAASFFFMNLSVSRMDGFDWNLGHYWSLSTEEQFYIIFPVILKKAWKLYVAILLFVVFVVPAVYYMQTIKGLFNTTIPAALIRYLIKFQGIAVGCLYAIMVFKGYFKFGTLRLPITIFSIAVIFYLQYSQSLNFKVIFNNLTISLFTGFIVINCITKSNDLLYKFLNTKALTTIGLLSYSIYIWQQLFLSNNPKFPASKFPFNLICLVVVVYLSYFFYEKSFLKLKSKFSNQFDKTTKGNPAHQQKQA